MRFVHMADIHFDSPFTVLASKKELSNIRRLEQRETFKKAIEYIKKEKIPFLFISGDLYEQEYIRESTIEYINNLFKTIPETKIFISPGNHDPFLNNSFYNTFNWNKNVTIFNEEIKKIELEEADIYGYGFSDFYCTNSKVDEIKIENKDKLNILITHGALDASKTLDMQYNPINSVKLRKIGFDYVALGHIHKSNYNTNEDNFIYPGSLISFGFDEIGEHGILDIKINKNNSEENNLNNLKINNNSEKNNLNNLKINNNLEENNLNNLKINNNPEENNLNNLKINNNLEENNLNNLKLNNNSEKNNLTYKKINKYIENIKFIKLDNRNFEEKILDISLINSEEELVEEVNKIEYDKDKFYKIVFKGTKNIEINNNRICKLIANKNILKVKDKTETNYNIDNLSKQKTLKGIFVKRLIEKLNSNPEQESNIKRAIEIGLKLFD